MSISAPQSPEPSLSATEAAIAANQAYARGFTDPGLGARPARQVAVVTCMDARLDLYPALGMNLGDCHVIRNGGGVVTDDVIRSLTISQRALGTRSVMLIHHTTCGLLSMTEDFRAELEQEVGQRPSWAVDSFQDLDQDVRQSIERVRTSPFLPHRDDVRGFVFDVATGELREVAPASA
ncbi:carbonic anhydrase [Streptomyces tubbatahanensis]|uniref:carbonic anhydrase n=1 Tax=Streptomyces tubbatahanensis TaxID=2923272 RepID=A0ABY3XQ62_9ACTN|nr:carbonic anhydrase [Streptomyces tubbatahanensis]UNS96556.1 carbonic anhydrase [Streptomyces tubbatahanensis]